MKILIISDAWLPQVNGVVRTYEYLSKTLENHGHEVKVIGPADFKHRMPMPGYSEIELVILPYKPLVEKIEAFQPESIHIATEGPLGWAARQYCLKNNIKFTTSYHTQFPEYAARRFSKFLPFLYGAVHRLGINLIKKFHAPSSGLFVTTQSMTDTLLEWGVKAPIKKLTRGIDTGLFYHGEKNLFHDLPRPVAIYVGRLAIEKSVEEFLAMPWEGSKVIVGHGPDEQELKNNFPDAHFMGKKTGKELADHYRSADVFVFPSRTDTFGIVLIEALACGLPVAAHDVIGPKDVVEEPFLGELSEDLSAAAVQALHNGTPEQRNKFVTENYTWEKAMEQFLEAMQPIEPRAVANKAA